MAKFKANGGKPSAAVSTPGPVEHGTLGTGVDSVNSGGLKTGERTGVTTGVTSG